ncbi:sugar porter family MFS transporter [Chelatococcus reniformis]|uniref:MFS transporter n=1 Tax=Chelatococcus reniformis TaxID=1494448 RepID=A0A916TY61_9HYPH|nr:sugar porter family MFS transporter [Chelatococcus reniformis]GGC49587.1 MFS transporter [Chelatococcus reniformis]
MVYLVAAVAGLAGFLFGFDEGIIAGALGLLRGQFGITPFMEGMVTSAVPFGALFGALVAGSLAASLGRRTSLLMAGLIFVGGAVLAGAAGGVWTLTAARIILGFAIGLAAIVAPLYISENAPAKHRGMLVSIYQLAITLGILGAYLVGYAFSESWRTMFMLGAVPGLALALGMFAMTDTPRWLASKGRLGEARAVIARIRGSDPRDAAVEAEMNAITQTVQASAAEGTWADLFAPVVRPALVVGIGLFLLQQVSGINAVIYYAPTIFQAAGFTSSSSQLLATVGIGIVNVLMTFVGMALIDRVGRRRLLYLGFAGTALGLGLIAVGALTDMQALGPLALAGLALFIGSFAASIGPLPWVMMSEIFPLKVRALGMSVASLANWGMNFVIVFSFPTLIATLGLGGVFAIYAGACVLGLIFTRLRVPETSGVTLEAIEAHLRSGRPFRDLGATPQAHPPGGSALAPRA